MKTFSDRLRYARRERKLTQKELARACGLSQSAIASYENDHRHTSRSLRKLAAILRIEMEWLETGKGPMEPPAHPATLREPHAQLKTAKSSNDWPFRQLTRAQYEALSPQQKIMLEDILGALVRSGAATPGKLRKPKT